MLRKLPPFSANVKARRGQGLVEYIVVVAAVAMIALVAVSIFGHKVADQYAIGAGMLPGASAEGAADNLPIRTASFAGFTADETTGTLHANGEVTWSSITGNSTLGEMDNNVVANGDNGSNVFVSDGDDEDWDGEEEFGTIVGEDEWYQDG